MEGPVATVRPRRPAWALAPPLVLIGLLATLGSGPAGAEIFGRPTDGDLRIDWSVTQDRKGQPRASGYIYNSRAGSWAVNVRVQVDTLDSSGQVIGSGLGYVVGDVPPSGRASFEVPIRVSGASYQVTIRTFDWRGYGQGGG